MRAGAAGAERAAMADVPFGVIGVPFRRRKAASSVRSVAFSFIHTNDMPLFWNFRVSPLPDHALRRAHLTLTTIDRFADAHRHDRHGLCGAGVGGLFRGFRSPGHLRGQGWREDRSLAPRRNPDFRARPRCLGGFQCKGRAAGLCHRTCGPGCCGGCGVHRRRHAVATRRRPRRSELRSWRGTRVLADISRPLSLSQAPLMFTGRRTAELIKYAANAFLATKITFINEIADLAEKVGADVQDVARGIGLDNRIGSKFLHAGPGFGGSCFPKDTRALVKIALDHDVPLRIVEAVLAVNDNRKRAMARKVSNAAGGSLRGKTVAVLGLTFKPDTDDMREAPSIPLVTGLLDMGAKVRAHDPVGMEQARRELPDIEYCDDPYVCVRGAHAMVIVTEWVQYRTLDLERLKRELAQPVVVDLRNIYRPEEMTALGFIYESVGRGTI